MTAWEEWAAARRAAGQDSADRGAFLLHLEALGALPRAETFGYPAGVAPAPARSLFFEAWNPPPVKLDVGPLLVKYAAQYALPMRALVGLIHAESGFNCRAERWGRHTDAAKAAIAAGDRTALQAAIDRCYLDGTPSDISFGLAQWTYPTAGGEGIGNGYASIDNLLAVRAILFEPEKGVWAAAKHYAERCYRPALSRGYTGDDAILAGYWKYNTGGWDPPAGVFAGNVDNYKSALVLADQVLAGKGWKD